MLNFDSVGMSGRRICYVLVSTATVLVITATPFAHHWTPQQDSCTTGNQYAREIHKQAEFMSPEEIFQYLHWTNSSSCLLTADFGFSVAVWNGIAAPDGHKAVCLDQVIAPVYKKCLVYSFGIKDNWSFDEDMAAFGCQVYSFDPSLGVGDHDHSQSIHFYNLGLAAENGLSSSGWNMKTASSIYQMLADRHGPSTLIDVFKIDIEFYEWEVIQQMLRSGFLIEKVKQFAVEIHFNAEDPLETFQRRARILQDLESIDPPSTYPGDDQKRVGGGFVRFSSRPNPGLQRSITILGGKEEYIGLELAWYNPRYYILHSNQNKKRLFPYY